MTASYSPRSDWRREDRCRKPLAPTQQARITGASDEQLVRLLDTAAREGDPAWTDALIGEAVSRWYVPVGGAV